MSGKSEAIVKTFQQILDIYKQIDMLMETSKELMVAGGWNEPKGRAQHIEGNVDHYHGVSHNFSQKVVRIPFYIQRPFVSDSEPTQIKYITVMIDSEDPSDAEKFEPVVVGTTLKFVDETNKKDWDGYWWYDLKRAQAKESNSEEHGPWILGNSEVREIQEQQDLIRSNDVRSNLQSVHTFGIPLVTVTNEETLQKKIIKPLLRA